MNETRKARDGKKKGTKPKEPERLKIGDNILIRDHTSKAFQLKYKDFCIVGLLGKNQDNHCHITKVHRRDIKKIPMTEKVCKLYEEEQTERTREGRKAVPTSKMPDLGWDIVETQLIHQVQKENSPNMTLPLQTLITIIILIIAVVKQMATQIKEIAKKAVQATENKSKKASCNKILRNIKDFHRTAMLVITIATNTQNPPGTRKPNDEYEESYQPLTSRAHS